MTPTLIAGLLEQFGLPMVQYFVGLYKNGNNPLTAAQLQALMDDVVHLSQYRSTDSLKAAGIAIVDGKVVPIAA
jgi:hypothetical protein